MLLIVTDLCRMTK